MIMDIKRITNAVGMVRVSVIPEDKLGRHGMDYAQSTEVPAKEILREILSQNPENPASEI